MKFETKKLLVLCAITLFLVVVGLVMQFNAAVNAVAVIQANGMTCGDCSGKVEKALLERGGVSQVLVDVPNGMVLAFFDSRSVDPRSLVAAVNRAGFPSRIRDLLTVSEYNSLVSGGAGCDKGGCGNCSKAR
jgi:copper chaperone CopZ